MTKKTPKQDDFIGTSMVAVTTTTLKGRIQGYTNAQTWQGVSYETIKNQGKEVVACGRDHQIRGISTPHHSKTGTTRYEVSMLIGNQKYQN